MARWYCYVTSISIVLALYASLAYAHTHTQVETLDLANGCALRMAYSAPKHPTAILLMLPGGTGRVELTPKGHFRHANDFTIRTRSDWLSRGYAVVIVDTPNDVTLRGYRHTAAYADVLARVIQRIRQQSSRPVFLLGSSQGTIAAVNGGAHVPDVAGIVLAESVSVKGHSGETIYSAGLESVHVPVLIVANHDDRCWVAPPEQADAIARAAQMSADITVVKVAGGQARTRRACGALSPHGYYGIESEVIDDIDHWLKQHSASQTHYLP